MRKHKKANTTELKVAFRNFVNAPRKIPWNCSKSTRWLDAVQTTAIGRQSSDVNKKQELRDTIRLLELVALYDQADNKVKACHKLIIHRQ